MSIDIIKATAITLLLLAVQVIVLNNIHLFGVATPLLLVYVIITMPSNTARWTSLTIGFMLGLVSDIFSNTPGVAAATLTFTAFLQPTLLKLFVSRDTPDSISPSARSLGFTKYMLFSFILVFIFCLLFFTLEQFNFFNIKQWLMYILGSTLLSFLLIITIESLRRE